MTKPNTPEPSAFRGKREALARERMVAGDDLVLRIGQGTCPECGVPAALYCLDECTAYDPSDQR